MECEDECWHPVGAASQFAPDRVRVVKVGDRTLAVGRARGAFFAVDDACPHAGASLGYGRIRNGCLVCPLHFWEFDVKTGECLRFGSPVATYPVRVENGILEIRV